jgi:methionyl-tRNA formyltransferase
MRDKMRILLITSDDLRHKWAANQLHLSKGLVGIVAEKKVPFAADVKTDDFRAAIDRHLEERSKVEGKLLGDSVFPTDIPLFQIENGNSNTTQVFEWVNSHRPDVVVLYGSSIIKDPILSFYERRVINVHLGLSPYYRGSGTNFWPLVDGLPECVGATIHIASRKVDAGNILTQVRPEGISSSDRAHEVGTKTIMTAFSCLCPVLGAYLNGDIVPKKQDLSVGKLCRRRDVTNEAVETMWTNFKTAMIPRYLAARRTRDEAYPIITL